VNMVYIYF